MSGEDDLARSRPTDLNLASATMEIEEVLERRDLAGTAVVVSAAQVAFVYKLHAGWSAINPSPDAPLGMDIAMRPSGPGDERASPEFCSAMHTVLLVRDYAERTEMWMGQLLGCLAQAGVTWRHTPHFGQPVMVIGSYVFEED